jgi:flagellar motor switch protein FliN
MAAPLTREVVAQAFAEQLSAAIGERFGVHTAIAPAEAWAETGCRAALPVDGVVIGVITMWFEGQGAQWLARAAAAGEGDLTPEAIAQVVRELTARAADCLSTTKDFKRLTFGAPVIDPSEVRGVPLTAVAVELANQGTCRIAVGAEVQVASPDMDDRLEAVLDVELPLVVRFGQAMLPLKTLAALGPGAMVDLARSPDDPVELMVGDRVVAHGDVVIVGGNYGVRITQLTDEARHAARLLEAR